MVNIAATNNYDLKQLGMALFGLYIINQGLLRETNAGTHRGKGL